MSPGMIARVCHEANRALTLMLSDVPVQPAWDLAPAEMQASCISGVEWRLKNREAPASAQHEEWCRAKRESGWAHGPVRDAEKKTHPALVPYEYLPEGVKKKDAVFSAIVLALSEAP